MSVYGIKGLSRQANFEKQLAEMPADFLQCRTLGHTLRPATLEVEHGVFELGLTCSNNCGLEVSLQRTVNGQVARKAWYGNKDYLFTRTGRLTTAERDAIWIAYLSELEANAGLPGG